jgi:hypothetical protein
LISKTNTVDITGLQCNRLCNFFSDNKKTRSLAKLWLANNYPNEARKEQLGEHKVEVIQIYTRGRAPAADKLSLAQFSFTTTEMGKPITFVCPNGQEVIVEPGRITGYMARFDPIICETCPFALLNRYRVTPHKRDQVSSSGSPNTISI